MLKSIEDFKPLVGSIIIAEPTGNNVRRGVEAQELVRFEVVGAGRKYVELKQISNGFTKKYHPKSGSTQGSINSGYGLNAGYIFYRTEIDHKKASELRIKKGEIFKYFNAFNKPELEPETIKKIYSLLFVETGKPAQKES